MSLPFLHPYIGLSSGLNTRQAASGGGVGGWVELGRTTLGSTQTPIEVTGLADKRYLMVLTNLINSGSFNPYVQLGNASIDTGSNYTDRTQYNGDLTDVIYTSQSSLNAYLGGGAYPRFSVGYIANKSNKEKLLIQHANESSPIGASYAPARDDVLGKWTNTTNSIERIKTNLSGNLTSGSEVVVLGWDPADTHTNNFWTELYSGDLSAGAAAYIDSGTITAKKYLWVQLYTQQSVDSNFDITFNADTGSNYTKRWSNDGGADLTNTSVTKIGLVSRTANLPQFTNMFIINNSANEKLVIAHQVNQMTAGAGTAPTRTELVGKWANTAAQITSMRITSGSGNLATKTILKVWGSD